MKTSYQLESMEPTEIYRKLREKIIWLDLMPEASLNMSELAEVFGVSRTPIKEALIKLEADGWVLRHATQFIVTPLSLKRIKEITEIRSILEAQANRLAMERISPDVLDSLTNLREKIIKVFNDRDNRRIIQLDVEFHTTLYKATGNSQLVELLERLLSHYLRFWLSLRREINPEVFFSETVEMIDSIKARNESRLLKASQNHVKRSAEEIMGPF